VAVVCDGTNVFGEPKIQHLDVLITGHQDVCGLQIAVYEALVMGGGDRLGQRRCDFGRRDRPGIPPTE
jgi:hypothetical protein